MTALSKLQYFYGELLFCSFSICQSDFFMPAISSSAPGKVILCGEHAVVYGHPAIALPVLGVKTRCVVVAKPGKPQDEVIINDSAIGLKCSLEALHPNNPLRKTIALTLSALSIDHLPSCEIQIHSSIPIGGGLGSSASVSVALTRAISTFVGHPVENESVNDIAFEIEKLHHTTPSGIDNSVITYATPLFYVKGKPLEWLDIAFPLTFLIANSGIKGSTRIAVSRVREKWLVAKEKYDSFFQEIGEITRSMRLALSTGSETQVGALMSQNHSLLQQLEVSIPQLDRMVEGAVAAGAYGAKLSGGGLGGNVLILSPIDKSEHITKALTSSGAVNVISTRIGIV
jgi:mevalonate kinase